MSPLTFLIFIAWLPLLWLEDHIDSSGLLFLVCYLHMITWNIAVTWWVANASAPGALGAFLANSLIMCIPVLLLHSTKKKFGRWTGYGAFIVFWIAFEFIHHTWELSWPWLTLGNSFALHPEWVQWYEYTGTTGGSIWILLSNVIAYAVFNEYRKNNRTRRYFKMMISWVILLLAPILVSRFILTKERNVLSASVKTATKNVVVVQPNIDPYTEKFTIPVADQLQKLIVLSEQQIDRNTSLVVWPETAIAAQVWEDELKTDSSYSIVWSFLKRHPFINLLSGIDSYKRYPAKDSATFSSRTYTEPDPLSGKTDTIYYDAYNTAAFIDADSTIQLYHKAKLVPGVETLPSFLSWMGKWFEDFGGISGTLGRDSERKVFQPWDNYYKPAPVICYESIYSDYITEYIRKGSNLLTIITNDGWWGNTPGYKQHMNYARLRAIETRRWVARSANTGISCFIDPLGNVLSAQPWDVASSIKYPVPRENKLTFFVRHGDMVSRAAVVVSILLIIVNIAWWVRKKFF